MEIYIMLFLVIILNIICLPTSFDAFKMSKYNKEYLAEALFFLILPICMSLLIYDVLKRSGELERFLKWIM